MFFFIHVDKLYQQDCSPAALFSHMCALPKNLQHQICRLVGSRTEDPIDVLRRLARDKACKEYIHKGESGYEGSAMERVGLKNTKVERIILRKMLYITRVNFVFSYNYYSLEKKEESKRTNYSIQQLKHCF